MNIGPHRTKRGSATGHGDDARAEELNNLRLALATFALQLDAFEMRTREMWTREQPFRTGMTAGIPVRPPESVADFTGKKMIGR